MRSVCPWLTGRTTLPPKSPSRIGEVRALFSRLPWLSAAIAVSVLGVRLAAAAASIDAAIEPTQIMLGESARLTVTTSGSGTLSVTLPVVAGLEFRVVGQSREIQMINGTTLESTSTIVRVTPRPPARLPFPPSDRNPGRWSCASFPAAVPCPLPTAEHPPMPCRCFRARATPKVSA